MKRIAISACLVGVFLVAVAMGSRLAVAQKLRLGEHYRDTGAEPSDFQRSLRQEPGEEKSEKKKSKKPEARVGLLGDPSAIEFRGIETFEVGQIRRALSLDHRFQRAATPTNRLIDLLTTLEARVDQGYRHAGIGVDVEAQIDGSRLVVSAKEKCQAKRFGQFVPANVGMEALAARLSAPRVVRPWTYVLSTDDSLSVTGQRMFEPGEVIRSDDQASRYFTTHAKASLLDGGYFANLATLDFTPRMNGDGLLDQHLDVTSNGPRLTVGEIEINGLTRHSREEVLDLLGLVPDDPLRAEVLQRACDRLEGCHRFWRHDVTVHVPTEPNRYGQGSTAAKVQIDLTEFEALPRLGVPFGEVDQAILRVAGWLKGINDFKKDIVIDYEGPYGHGDVVFSPAVGAVLIDVTADAFADSWFSLSLNHAAVAEPGRWLIIDRRRGERLTVNPAPTPVFNLICRQSGARPDRPGASVATVGMATTDDIDRSPWADGAWYTEIAAVSLLRIGRDGSLARLEGEELIVEEGTCWSRFKASTGELVAFSDELLGGSLQARVEEGAFESRRAEVEAACHDYIERFDAVCPRASLVTFAVDQLESQTSVRERPALDIAGRATREVLADPAIEAWISNSGGGTDRRDEGFSIPDVALDEKHKHRRSQTARFLFDWWRYGVGHLPAAADALFPRETWAWTVLREYGLLAEQNCRSNRSSTATVAELDRLLRVDEVGPLSGLVIAAWADSRGARRAADTFTERALAKLDEASVARDLVPFVAEDFVASRLTARLVLSASTLDADERQAVLGALPTVMYRPAVALFARLDSHFNQPPLVTVREAALEAWRDGWREEIKAELQRIAEE